MIAVSDATVWAIIAVLGACTFLIRYSFLGAFGRRSLPPWAMRLLRYTPVTVLPALIAPATILPPAGGGVEPVRLTVAALVLAVGIATRSTPWAMAAGFAALPLGLWLAG